tara:strand:+ start:832 stop:969 length:138 start_codon:yes stop_codon:yes gene_type:complete
MNDASIVPPIVAYSPFANGIGHGFQPVVGVNVFTSVVPDAADALS